jgi:hypothetical protein
MFFEKTNQSYLVRVRLAPNSSSCRIDGTTIGPNDEEYLKIALTAVPEKGKANEALIAFLSKQLGLSKSAFTLVSGTTAHWKKIVISADTTLQDHLTALTEKKS